VLSGLCLAGCAQSPDCSTASQQPLVGGTEVIDAGGILLRPVPEAPAPVVCTAVQLTADWYVTAGHCSDGAPRSRTHPSLDLALAPGSAPPAWPGLPIYLGDLPERARILSYATDPNASEPVEVGYIVEGSVALRASGETYVSAEVQAEGPSVCEGDSGSGLFLDSDRGPLLLGILSSSAAAPGSLCTPTRGQQYWVRLAAARDWLEQQIGPCQPGLSDAGAYCVFPTRGVDPACL
jgi:hypothetical protein